MDFIRQPLLVLLAVFTITHSQIALTAPDSISVLNVEEGIHVGNGGDVIVCRNGDVVTRIELLDHYEGALLRNMHVSLGAAELPIAEKIEIALKRLQRIDPDRAAYYRGLFSNFWDSSQFLSGIVLSDIPDSQHVALPAGANCRIEQIAIQRQVTFPEDFRYIINKDLWDLLDNTSKAGLVLHEILLHEAIAIGIQHSIGVRYLNSLISSDSFDSISLARYSILLRSAEFKQLIVDGIAFFLSYESGLSFYDENRIAFGPVVEGSIFDSPYGPFQIRCNAARYESGKLRFLQPSSSVSFEQAGLSWHHETPLDLPPVCGDGRYVLSFYENGLVAQSNILTSRPIIGEKYRVQVAGYVNFCANGRLQYGYTGPSTYSPSIINGVLGKCPLAPKSEIEFFCDGKMQSVNLGSTRCVVEIGSRSVMVDNRLWYHEDGSVRIAAVVEGEISAGVNGNLIPARTKDTNVSFYSSGFVHTAILEHGSKLKVVGGGEEWFEAGTRLKFDESGYVVGRQ